MDYRLMYKSNLRTDSTQNRRNLINKQRSDHRSILFSKSRNISTTCNDNLSPSTLSSSKTMILKDSSNNHNKDISNTNSKIKTINTKLNNQSIKIQEKNKKQEYLEKFRKWKQEKENRIKEEKEKQKLHKPFISAVRPKNGFNINNTTAIIKEKAVFKPPIKKIGNKQQQQPQSSNQKKVTGIVKPILKQKINQQQQQATKETKKKSTKKINNCNNFGKYLDFS